MAPSRSVTAKHTWGPAGRIGPGSGRGVDQVELGVPDAEPVPVDTGDLGSVLVGHVEEAPVELDALGQLPFDVHAVVQGAGDLHGRALRRSGLAGAGPVGHWGHPSGITAPEMDRGSTG